MKATELVDKFQKRQIGGAPIRDLIVQLLPWIMKLPIDGRDECIRQIVRGIIEVPQAGFQKLDEVLVDWKATAEVQADPELAADLKRPVVELADDDDVKRRDDDVVKRREDFRRRMAEKDAAVLTLLSNIKARHGELTSLVDEVSPDDVFYRFYSGSFKAYSVQEKTLKLVEVLRSLLPDWPLNETFMDIVQDGTGKEFSLRMNNNWYRHGRPMLEAYFHAREFVVQACKYGAVLMEEDVRGLIDPGWASVLSLYNIR